jgi:FkbM family methyltransferase
VKIFILSSVGVQQEFEDTVAFVTHYFVAINVQLCFVRPRGLVGVHDGENQVAGSLATRGPVVQFCTVAEVLLPEVAPSDSFFLMDSGVRRDEELERLISSHPPRRVVEIFRSESSTAESVITNFSGALRGMETLESIEDGMSNKIKELRGLNRKALLVGTGPSSSLATELDPRDYVSIVCNTIIRDHVLMERLDPSFVVFSDPAYHFGPSSYASGFRNDLVQAAAKFPNFHVVTIRKHHEFLLELAPSLEGRVFSVDTSGRESPINTRLDFAPVVRGLPNILTLLMLPLGASVGRVVEMVGFDGRRPEDKHFWAHNPKVQDVEGLESVRSSHPGFHRQSYSTYVSQHDRQLEEVIRTVEARNIRVVSLAESALKSLETRFQPPVKAEKNDADLLISISPNWKDDFGHFSSWNLALANECSRQGIGFVCLAGARLVSPHPWVRPVIGDLGATQPSAYRLKKRVEKLAKSLEREIMMKKPFTVAVVAYEATERDLSIYAKLASRLPSVRFFCNILHPFERFEDPAALPASLPANLIVCSDNDLGAGIAARLFGKVSDFPHFAPNYPGTLPTSIAAKTSGPYRIFFGTHSGSMRGFSYSEALIERLQPFVDAGKIQIVRKIPVHRPSHPQQKLSSGDPISGPIEVHEGFMEGEDYLALIATCDLTVIPYTSDFHRTSGLALDSLLAGVPLLTFEGNWISKIGGPSEGVYSVPFHLEAMANQVSFWMAKESFPVVPPEFREALHERFGPARLIRFLFGTSVLISLDPSVLRSAEELRNLRRRRRGAMVAGLGNTGKLAQPKNEFRGFELTHLDSPVPYDQQANLEETEFLALLIGTKSDSAGPITMVDVGAGVGSAFRPFEKLGAKIWAIEAHPVRAENLRQSFAANSLVKVVEAAISDRDIKTTTLFDSDVSWGISSIDQWHPSHYAAHTVPVLRLSDLKLPKKISFLKVDTEGHDLSVLRSLDWESHDVEVVMAEFDDQKADDGEFDSWEPILQELRGRGYWCVVSEWYPVERYGQRHRWRRLNVDSAPMTGSWGNIIGFKQPQVLDELFAALQGSLKFLAPEIPLSPRKSSSHLHRFVRRFLGRVVLAAATVLAPAVAPTLTKVEFYLETRLPRVFLRMKKASTFRRTVRKFLGRTDRLN